MSKTDLEAAKEEISNFLRKSLNRFVGQMLNREEIEKSLLAMLEDMEKRGIFPRELDKYNRAATEFMSTMFGGFPEGFDPKTFLRDLPTHLLVMLSQSFSRSVGFPQNVIWLEIFYREGKLVDDWSFTRVSKTEGKLNFQLKNKLDYIALDMTISEEKRN